MASKIFSTRLRPTLVLATAVGTLACAGGEVLDSGSNEEGTGDTGDTAGSETDGSESEESVGETTEESSTDDGECSSAGCACDGSEGSCDAGLECIGGVCGTASCNADGVVDPGEECDDGNDFEGDGCDNDCTWTEVLDVQTGRAHTCALIESGRVRCWGLNNAGQLGYKNTENIGDNEVPAEPADVPLGGEEAMSISVGGSHTCVNLASGSLRCWGEGGSGQLGLGNNNDVGDDEFPFDVSTVNITEEILGIAAGGSHTCVLIGNGEVRCWGLATSGQLGYGNNTSLVVPLGVDVQLGTLSVLLRAGEDHNCALLDDGKLRCWGRNNKGQLGYGNTENIGDTETPNSQLPVPLTPQGVPSGTALIDLDLGYSHTCVLYETGDVVCWGDNFYGQLGQGNTDTIGDDETLNTLFPIDLGGEAVSLRLGKQHSCAMLEGDEIKCWGRNIYGQLGRGDIQHIGDDEVPADIGTIELGGAATAFDAGDYHTCAVVDGHEVYCWGFNDYGQLGYADTQLRGDDEVPSAAGPVQLF
ncbi:hypothetical protein G6O69_11810 [Pseudenhygromyxa sp. WMMC2535]|uniref:RCC1 domain-containing protein n=1 Tax=Pseudenhygromyxa sp. WMMC2535 TaxID=2712867 RepID=UPI0015530F95|nr:hypothetical protein [Pseudenhygromyxa sp. WMMC2535]NVB38517.1 hypothetical protein [Pseudenhygromyxa sp. WMMC2535]